MQLKQLFDLLRERGNGQYGLDDVRQVEHALQSAQLAQDQGLPDEEIIAALFHDIGHLGIASDTALADEGIDDLHERRGAEILAPLFGLSVSGPVLGHVPAKRYLCAVEPDYFAKLSPDSVRSLELQGGPMSREEIIEFESLPYAAAAVRLRRIDEQAKVAGLETRPLESYWPLARRLLAERPV